MTRNKTRLRHTKDSLLSANKKKARLYQDRGNPIFTHPGFLQAELKPGARVQ